ncbi:MFS transporter [Gordoniibacillus kamchatkensis]|uniref:MFS transporter n=1 Tax=Gordoniibacillus kamchatkensis TaxID=1590651 RepID=UPI000ABF7869|nr:MFS transporter [Paenibacillus sp. VKM B-2647]
MGQIGTKMSYEKVLFIGLIGGDIGNLLQILFHSVVGFGLHRFAYGLFFAAVFPALNAFIAKHTAPGFRSRAFALNQTANQLGLLLGPLIGGFLASQMSITIVFAINGCMLLAVALILKIPKLPMLSSNVKAKENSSI